MCWDGVWGQIVLMGVVKKWYFYHLHYKMKGVYRICCGWLIRVVFVTLKGLFIFTFEN